MERHEKRSNKIRTTPSEFKLFHYRQIEDLSQKISIVIYFLARERKQPQKLKTKQTNLQTKQTTKLFHNKHYKTNISNKMNTTLTLMFTILVVVAMMMSTVQAAGSNDKVVVDAVYTKQTSPSSTTFGIVDTTRGGGVTAAATEKPLFGVVTGKAASAASAAAGQQRRQPQHFQEQEQQAHPLLDNRSPSLQHPYDQ